MAETVDESAFWLPSDFLTDDDFFLTANRHANPNSSLHLQTSANNGGLPLFCRSSSALNSPGESSTGTESSDDPDEFIAELTRHLAQSSLLERASKPQEKPWGVLATSPQSTLAGIPEWTNRYPPSGTKAHPPVARSPPAFQPTHDDALELIYAAAVAERAAKMRMMDLEQAIRRELLRPSSHMASPCTPPVRFNVPQNNQFQQMKIQAKQAWLSQHQAHLRSQQQNHPLNHHGCGGGCGPGAGMRAVFLGGSGPAGVKRQSTGTGVFLPRRTANNAPSEPRKKQGCSTVLVPARVAQALNLNIDEMNGNGNGHGHGHTQTQPCLSASNHEILMARRNAVLAQPQRRGLRVEGPMGQGHEAPVLPQEWTY